MKKVRTRRRSICQFERHYSCCFEVNVHLCTRHDFLIRRETIEAPLVIQQFSLHPSRQEPIASVATPKM